MTKYQEIFNKYTIDDFRNDYGYTDGIITCQLFDEFKMLLDIYVSKHPKRVLEIGTETGGTLYYWSKYAHSNNIIVSLDTNHSQLAANYKKWNPNIHLVTGNSNDPDTFNKVKEVSPEFDFIFIDGNHYIPYPLNDFCLYSKLAAANAIIAMHDIQGSGPAKGPIAAWKYIKECGYITQEFIHPDMIDYGIGIVYI